MPDGQAGPGMGAQFAQLVKEVRSAYGNTIKACAEAIAASLARGHSILRLLQQHGLSPDPALISTQVRAAACLHMARQEG